MKRLRYAMGGLIFVALGLLLWETAAAHSLASVDPPQIQMRQILPTLRDSAAEHVDGAYIPGLGAVITMDLLRGPNAVKGKPAYQGTRDWGIYLLQTFGPKLNSVPANETIAFSIEFYDYGSVSFHQLVLTSSAGHVSDAGTYQIWLDGKPYAEATGQAPAAPVEQNAAAPAAAPATVAPKQNAAPPAPPATVAPAASPSAAAAPTAGGATGTTQVLIGGSSAPSSMMLDFGDASAAGSAWKTVGGQWSFINGGYDQAQLGMFDLISLYQQPLTGNYRWQANVQYLAGDMGAGLIFNTPGNSSKQGGQMISYTGKGSYLQWGYFDGSSLYQYQGGTGVANGSDGAWHTLMVQVTGTTFSVTVDKHQLASAIPLHSPSTGYVGLLASTSHVLFDNVQLEAPAMSQPAIDLVRPVAAAPARRLLLFGFAIDLPLVRAVALAYLTTRVLIFLIILGCRLRLYPCGQDRICTPIPIIWCWMG